MANYKQLLIGVPLALALVFVLNVNSFPTDARVLEILSYNQSAELSEAAGYVTGVDCDGHGHLTNGSICACDRGWTTYDNVLGAEELQCSYQQRSKRTAFLISLFTGYTGSDWFYLSRNRLGYIVLGLLKLLVIFGCCTSWPLIFFKPEIKNSEVLKTRFRGISTFFTLLALAWWIVDWARIVGNRFPDGNGIELARW